MFSPQKKGENTTIQYETELCKEVSEEEAQAGFNFGFPDDDPLSIPNLNSGKVFVLKTFISKQSRYAWARISGTVEKV